MYNLEFSTNLSSLFQHKG